MVVEVVVVAAVAAAVAAAAAVEVVDLKISRPVVVAAVAAE